MKMETLNGDLAREGIGSGEGMESGVCLTQVGDEDRSCSWDLEAYLYLHICYFDFRNYPLSA